MRVITERPDRLTTNLMSLISHIDNNSSCPIDMQENTEETIIKLHIVAEVSPLVVLECFHCCKYSIMSSLKNSLFVNIQQILFIAHINFLVYYL